MTTPGQVARSILDAVQDAFDGHDLPEVMRLLDDEVVLFGTSSANLDRAQTEAFIAGVIGHDGTLRWGWDHVMPVYDGPDVLAFAVVGTVGFEDAQGQPISGRDEFRLTCVAVLRDNQWRLRHFHGSVPQQS